MNICFVYPTLFNPMRGGIERVTDILTKALLKRGYTVLYLHNKRDDALAGYDFPAPVYYFPHVDYHDPRNVEFYHNFLRSHRVDVVVNQCGNFGDSVLYLDVPKGVKTVSVLHSNPLLSYDHLAADILQPRNNTPVEYVKLLGRIVLYPRLRREYLEGRRWQINYLSEHTDVICLLSWQFKPEIERLASEANCETALRKLRAIPNPNTYSTVEYAKFRKEKLLLYVGRLDRGQKRPDRLLAIWKKLYKKYPDWQMVVVGDGPERSGLEKRSRQMERISFVGFQDPVEWYKRAGMFCMTSNFEGWGMVLVEAMTFGVVPLAFDSYASVRDIITDGETGYLIPPYDIDEYARKLGEIMDKDESWLADMGARCRDSVRRYSIKKVVDQWEQLFKELKS